MSASGNQDYDSSAFKLRQTLQEHTQTIHRIAWSPDGHMLATIARDGCIVIWDATIWEISWKWLDSSFVAQCMAWSWDGSTLALGGNERIAVWDKTTKQVHRWLQAGYQVTFSSVSWSPDGQNLAAGSDDKNIYLWNRKDGNGHQLIGHCSTVCSLAWSSDGRILASGGEDGSIGFWKPLDHKEPGPIYPAHRDAIRCLARSPDGQNLASGSLDRTILVWDLSSGQQIRTLEGHTAPITELSFLPKDRLLASKDLNGTLRLWHWDTWRMRAEVKEPFSQKQYSTLAFHPSLSLLATLGQVDTDICIWDMDIDKIPSTLPDSVYYRNAKVIIVGGNGVGKTSLAFALADQPPPTELQSEPYIGIFDRQEVAAKDGHREIHETLLWDIAGGPGYSLLHNLYLRDASVAIVVFDAHSGDPFDEARRWNYALHLLQDTKQSSGHPMKKLLVASRVDRGGLGISAERSQSLQEELGFDGFFETSVSEGWGIAELKQALQEAIDWEALPKVTSNDLFQRIRAFLMAKKASGQILLATDVLYKDFLLSEKTLYEPEDLSAQFETCIALAGAQGMLRRFGNRVLLRLELLDVYILALLSAARDQPDGLGYIAEKTVLTGTFFPPEKESVRLQDKGQEMLLLYALVQDLWSHEIAFVEDTDKGRILIFPSQSERKNEDLPDPEEKAVTFSFEGTIPQRAVADIYTVVAVRLANSGVFEKDELWKNAVTYKSEHGERCGISLQNSDEEHGKLTVFFDKKTQEAIRFSFATSVHRNLQRLARKITHIEFEIKLICPVCGTEFLKDQITRRRELGGTTILCNVCEKYTAQLPILPDDRKDFSAAYMEIVKQMERTADDRREREISDTQLQFKLASGDFDACFLYEEADKFEIERVSKELWEKCGVLAWLEDWNLQPGLPIEETIAKKIRESKAVAVFIGSSGVNRLQNVRLSSALDNVINNRGSVIPVLFRSTPENLELPSILTYSKSVDLREWNPNPIERLAEGIKRAKSGKL